MTVEPVQDLIVDVMAAADPVSQRLAADRLERLARTNGDFATTLDHRIETGAAEKNPSLAAASNGSAASTAAEIAAHAPIVRTNGQGEVYRKFEAFVLQTFVESMLPKDADDVFGKGTAGSVWRSMLAEHIANEMARGDGVGIAKQLAKSRASSDAAAAEG